ncbi:MAG: hypothetical protein ACTHKL_01490 [Streptosporangiaceae bacterium]
MSEEVRQATPPDEELREYWERLPDDEVYLRGVEVAAPGEPEDFDWQVTVFAGEYFRQDPLGPALAPRLRTALSAVAGVANVERIRSETWEVNGASSGEALCRAAVSVVDDLTDRMRTAYESLE